MSKIPEISVIIPAYNEGGRILGCLAETEEYLKKSFLSYEIIVVNDGSRDNTLDIIGKLPESKPAISLITYTQNMGKGYALRKGMLAARGEHCIFFDADLAVPLDTIGLFLKIMAQRGADIIIGTRKIKSADILKRQSPVREFLGKGFSKLTNFILGTEFTDITCGFKCFTNAAAKKIFSAQKINRWSFDSEILFLATRMKLKTVEIPVTWKNGQDTKVRILKDVISSFIDLLRIRLSYPGKKEL